MQDVQTIVTFVATSVWQVWPAFLISVGLGVLISRLKMDGAIRRAFGARVDLAIVLATLVGAFSPFCSCTVVPVVSGLLLSGVPLAPVMAFWVASPTMDPEIFALSVATIGWPLAVTRLGATLLLSLAAGYLTLIMTRTGWLSNTTLRQTPPEQCCATAALQTNALMPAAPANGIVLPIALQPDAFSGSGGSCALPMQISTLAQRSWRGDLYESIRTLDWHAFGREVAHQSWLLGRWLLLAFVLEALITFYVPQATIAGVLGTQSGLAIPLAALIGVPLYLSNISALPIVAGLLTQGMQPGAAIAFLIAGPVTTVPAMTAVWGIVQRRVFGLYLGIGLLGAAAVGWLTNLLFMLL